jgi:hypothetical protein
LVKSRLKIDYWFILCFGLLPLVLKKINNSSKLFYEQKAENEEHALNLFHKLWVFFGCILSQMGNKTLGVNLVIKCVVLQVN